MKTALVTCIDTAFGEMLAAIFAREGYETFALGEKVIENVTLLPTGPCDAAATLKEKVGKLDYFLDTTDFRSPQDNFTVRDGIERAVVEMVFRQNVLASMALLEAFLLLLDSGEGKRLFYLTRAEASINETRRIDHYAYNMSKAALHQFIQMTRNKLISLGYTFRVFDPLESEVSPVAAAESAYNYVTRRRGTENHDPLRDDEDNLVFRDAEGRQHSW
jgi:NAD(P)-dependent dehydrogenase (short-subunit alcohol dehydrogenase family)